MIGSEGPQRNIAFEKEEKGEKWGKLNITYVHTLHEPLTFKILRINDSYSPKH